MSNFIINEGKSNHLIKEKNIGLSILKRYNLFVVIKKEIKRIVKKVRLAFVYYIIFKLI